MAERRCGHGRHGQDVERCPLCAMRISPAAYWYLIRELRRSHKAKRTRTKANRDGS